MVKKKSLAYYLLFGLEKTLEVQVKLIDFTYNPHLYAYSGYPRNLDYGSLYKAAKQLREKGFIDIEKDAGKIIMKLTEQGKKEMAIIKALAEQNWDGKWRVVIFDIPEKHRHLRDVLRSKLGEWGFKQWQKSVWISKKDIALPLRDFIKDVGLSEWVKVLISTDIDMG